MSQILERPGIFEHVGDERPLHRRRIDASLACGFDIAFCRDLLSALPRDLAAAVAGRRALVLSTPTVARLYGDALTSLLQSAGADAQLRVLALSEQTKTPQTLMDLCQTVHDAGLGRRDVLVALGGGVCSDLVRMGAALYRRGVDHICVPTTLIGQVDAAIGVKAGVNFDGAKSALGVFQPPHSTWIDPALLASLPHAPVRDGLAEILKLALSCDEELFSLLEAHGAELLASRFRHPQAAGRQVLARAVDITLDQLAPNLFERNTLRRRLDFGHTFSPLIEARSGFELSHGQAVAIDIAYSTAVAVELGALRNSEAVRILGLMRRLDLPRTWPGLSLELAITALEAAASHRGGDPNLVIPTDIGASAILDRRNTPSPSVLTGALRRLASLHGPVSPPAPEGL